MRISEIVRGMIAAVLRIVKRLARPGAGPKFVVS
jgi:hypothetical protein